MSNETEYIKQVTALLQPLLVDDMFLVDVSIKPTNNIKIFIDADTGLTIEKSIKVNRALYNAIDEQNIFPAGDFSLEVSSPGVDEPLKLLRQYKKNIGRKLKIVTTDQKEIVGELINVTENDITQQVVTGKGKKQETQTTTTPFENILKATVQITF